MSNIENITFGVEIETTVPFAAQILVGQYHAGRAVNSATSAAGVRIESPKFNGAAWNAENDGSIRADKEGHRSCEWVSPILKGEAGVRHLIEFVEWLRSIGASVNTSCGLHIHVGAAGAAGEHEVTDYIERLARLSAFNSKALYAQTGTIARENGMFCRPIGDQCKKAVAKAKKTKRLIDAAHGAGRYQLLNLTNLTSRGTVEFRCFAGTLNTSKVLVHLFSVLVLCIVARTAKTPAQWDNRPLTGEKAVSNLLKVRPVTRIIGAQTFTDRFSAMIAKALEMAGKYDAMQAALDLVTLTRPTAAR